MKPAPFEYFAPTTVDEALSHLSEHGYDAKLLAGGQSLIPMMNFRLAQPAILVDLNNVSELFYIHPDQNGGLLLGAMARHNLVENSDLIAERAPLISETMPKIATTQIRSRGTFGGCIAHADPSAELCAVSLALGARFRLRSQRGERWVPADEFYMGLFTTLLEPDEILMETAIPSLKARTGWAIEEVARRPHDYALVGVVALVSLDDRDRCQQARLVLLSVGDIPVHAQRACEILNGQVLTEQVIAEAAELAATADIDPGTDIHASAEFRRHLARVLSRRALKKANERARNNTRGASHG